MILKGNNFCTQHVLPRFELGIFMNWTCNLMNNLSSFCGLVDAKIKAFDKDLPVLTSNLYKIAIWPLANCHIVFLVNFAKQLKVLQIALILAIAETVIIMWLMTQNLRGSVKETPQNWSLEHF